MSSEHRLTHVKEAKGGEQQVDTYEKPSVLSFSEEELAESIAGQGAPVPGLSI